MRTVDQILKDRDAAKKELDAASKKWRQFDDELRAVKLAVDEALAPAKVTR